jgi:hypothetical protein
MDRLGWPLNWWPLLMSTASAVFSGAHLAAILFPRKLRRLYIARDNDAAGDGAVDNLEPDCLSLSRFGIPARCDF